MPFERGIFLLFKNRKRYEPYRDSTSTPISASASMCYKTASGMNPIATIKDERMIYHVEKLQNRKRYEPYRDRPVPAAFAAALVGYKTASGMNPIATQRR